MTTISAIIVLATLSQGQVSADSAAASVAPGATPGVFREIDARYQRGEIDLDRLHYLRVAAIRAPAPTRS